MVRKLAGKMYYEKLAIHVGTSRSNLMRWARDNKVSLDAHSYKDELVEKVCAFYEKFGRNETQKRFPNVKVRSVVERYKRFSPRQVRWTNSQIIEAARMAGLVSPKAQAKYFNRPHAFEGSIKSLWVKRFGFGQGNINGMTKYCAKELIRGNGAARYLRPIGLSRRGNLVEFRNLILWIDMENCLKPDVPDFIREAIKTMADFQRWLHGARNTRKRIINMIREREIA